MEYKGMDLKEACRYVVNDKLVMLGGEGGLVAIDHLGNIELPFNSEGMYRAWKHSSGDDGVLIYKS
jgi:beta-aspartyl-peptidase (threonine type)